MERRTILLTATTVTALLMAYKLYRQKIENGVANGFRPVLNPMIERSCDNYGCGNYGASRDGGSRTHKGTDIASTPGQQVYAPFNGVVARISKVYDNDTRFDLIDILGDNGWYVRLFYVNPLLSVGARVEVGQLVATAKSLQIKYPGITDHVHLELRKGTRTGQVYDPTTFFTQIV